MTDPGSRTTRRLWITVYLSLVLAPFALMLAAPRPTGRSFLVELGAALGFAALVILVLQVVLPSRARPFTSPFGIDLLLRFHRHIGLASIVLVAAHLAVLLIDDPARLRLLDLRIAPWRARAGVGALVFLGILGASSVWRRWFKLSYEGWRAVHIVLGGGLILLSFAHMVGVNHYLSTPSIWLSSLLLLGLAGWGLSHLRLGRPHAASRKPYVVTGIRRERGDAHTVQLRALGHPGHRFRPGQFAWVKLAGEAYSLEEHPFSYSSSASRPDRPEFTVKSLGDFSGSAGSLALGTRVLLDGPHGAFAPPHPHGDYLLIAGGVGITPMMSILTSLADRGDRRRIGLVYASRDWDSVIFREQLNVVARRLDLEVHHVLSRPGEGWSGLRGRLSPSIVGHGISRLRAPFNVFVCGSPGVVDSAESHLSDLGIPASWVHSERFASV